MTHSAATVANWAQSLGNAPRPIPRHANVKPNYAPHRHMTRVRQARPKNCPPKNEACALKLTNASLVTLLLWLSTCVL